MVCQNVGAVILGVVGKGDGNLEGVDHGGGVGQQRPHCCRVHKRLAVSELLAVDFFYLVNPIDFGVVQKLVHLFQVGVGICDDQGAGMAQVKAQFLGELRVHSGACRVQLGLQGARMRVVPWVDDSAVSLGGANAHVHSPLHQGCFHIILCQLVGDPGTGDAPADNDYIVIFHCKLLNYTL